ncbi:MAG: class I SAM-dependent methyltransferase [Nitrospinae bacterium]|jgi:tellurite methyltransferase|nr:class I SAM-dependent methyltransferase [Nitrospinota bacterium]MDA1109602.1 class I SAM-dependent methyltransferase [Nitrospinota bacterium]
MIPLCRPVHPSIFRGICILVFLLLIPAQGIAKEKDKSRWDGKYDTETYIFGKTPIPFLVENLHLLPKGKTLDIAMGEGRNGVYLAAKGFNVLGLDISEKGLQKARQLAESQNAKIETQVVDLETHTLEKNAYDLIICTYYMQRDLFPQFMEALKPGGMALVETYNMDYLKYAKFNPKWLLETNELLEIFKGFKIIRYQAFDDGEIAYSSILVQKP